MPLGPNFERALSYALHAHDGHLRKGSDAPYFSHLMAVSATVLENGGNETEAIAALLHDAVEDQGGRPRLEDIRKHFGDDVARIVEACSDSLDTDADGQKEDWLMRKRRYLATLAHKTPSMLAVTTADKLHNARAIWRDAQALGPDLWKRFGKPTEQSIAYYTALCHILGKVHATPATAELGEVVARLESLIEDRAAHRRYLDELLAAG